MRRAYCGRGAGYHKKGEYDKAVADYNEAIRLDPKDGQAYYGRGLAYEEKGDKTNAEKDFAQAKQLGYEP